jgi:hypothetical protein
VEDETKEAFFESPKTDRAKEFLAEDFALTQARR